MFFFNLQHANQIKLKMQTCEILFTKFKSLAFLSMCSIIQKPFVIGCKNKEMIEQAFLD